MVAETQIRLSDSDLRGLDYSCVFQLRQYIRQVITTDDTCESLPHPADRVFKRGCGQNCGNILRSITRLIQNSSRQLDQIGEHFTTNLLPEISGQTGFDLSFQVLQLRPEPPVIAVDPLSREQRCARGSLRGRSGVVLLVYSSTHKQE